MHLNRRPYFATINPAYFTDYPHLTEVLSKRTRLYLGIIIEINDCHCFVPLRNKIKTGAQFRKAGYPLPSATRVNAGLDYRKILIINDLKYINVQTKVEIIPAIQKNKIYADFDKICDCLNKYIKAYIKEVKRNRVHENYLLNHSKLKNIYLSCLIKKINI